MSLRVSRKTHFSTRTFGSVGPHSPHFLLVFQQPLEYGLVLGRSVAAGAAAQSPPERKTDFREGLWLSRFCVSRTADHAGPFLASKPLDFDGFWDFTFLSRKAAPEETQENNTAKGTRLVGQWGVWSLCGVSHVQLIMRDRFGSQTLRFVR